MVITHFSYEPGNSCRCRLWLMGTHLKTNTQTHTHWAWAMLSFLYPALSHLFTLVRTTQHKDIGVRTRVDSLSYSVDMPSQLKCRRCRCRRCCCRRRWCQLASHLYCECVLCTQAVISLYPLHSHIVKYYCEWTQWRPLLDMLFEMELRHEWCILKLLLLLKFFRRKFYYIFFISIFLWHNYNRIVLTEKLIL